MQKIALVAVFVMAAAAAVATPYLSGPQLRSVQMLLARAAEEGLDPAAYGVALAADTPAGQAAVTHALLDYMRDVRSGRPQLRALHSDVLLPPDDFDAAAALDQALAAGHLDALLTDLPPPDPGYQNLKPWLAHYQRIAAAGGWPVLTAHADSALLRTRLAFEDEITGLPDAVAVARFQAWHGLTPGGTLDAATLAALNVPALARANSIAANMERWRWLPRQLEPDRIVINVADARLDLFLDGKHVLTSRVIVGKPSTPTPILRSPVADSSHINMDKIRRRVVADTTRPRVQGNIAQTGQRPTGNTDVNSHALHVQALGGDARMAAFPPQHGIGGRRAITGNHAERRLGFQSCMQKREQVEQTGRNGMDLAGPEIAQ